MWMHRKLGHDFLKLLFVCAAIVLFGSSIATSLLACDLHKVKSEEAGKFQTTEKLRAAMVGIRKMVTDNHSLVTHRRMPVARAQSMAKRVLQLVAEIREVADIGQDARDAIESVLSDVELGVRGVAGIDKTINPIDGIVLMDEALSKYAKQFEHPGWKGIREL